MKRHRNVALSLLLLFVLGASIVSVQALPTCEKLVKSFVEKRVKNRVSKKTAERWALWNKSHPDFKPRPRPKYKLTKQEVVSRIELACETPGIPAGPPDTVDLPPEIAVLPASPVSIPYILPNLPPVVEVATNGEPPLTFIPPYTTGLTPPAVAAVPEPNGFVLAVTGALVAAMFVVFSRSRQKELAA